MNLKHILSLVYLGLASFTPALACGPATLCLDDQPLVDIPSAIFFPRGSTTVDESARAHLERLADTLNTAAYSKVQVKLIGHADPTGPASVNQTLSQARADTVKNTLALQGVSAERIQAEGLGVDLAIKDQASKRRVDIQLVR